MYLALHTTDKRTNDDNVRYWGGDDQPAAVGKKEQKIFFSALSSCENLGEKKSERVLCEWRERQQQKRYEKLLFHSFRAVVIDYFCRNI